MMMTPAKYTAIFLLLLTASLTAAADHHQPSDFDVVVEQYLTIQSALAGDTLDGVSLSALYSRGVTEISPVHGIAVSASMRMGR